MQQTLLPLDQALRQEMENTRVTVHGQSASIEKVSQVEQQTFRCIPIYIMFLRFILYGNDHTTKTPVFPTRTIYCCSYIQFFCHTGYFASCPSYICLILKFKILSVHSHLLNSIYCFTQISHRTVIPAGSTVEILVTTPLIYPIR